MVSAVGDFVYASSVMILLAFLSSLLFFFFGNDQIASFQF